MCAGLFEQAARSCQPGRDACPTPHPQDLEGQELVLIVNGERVRPGLALKDSVLGRAPEGSKVVVVTGARGKPRTLRPAPCRASEPPPAPDTWQDAEREAMPARWISGFYLFESALL